jgi:hypothetical protein
MAAHALHRLARRLPGRADRRVPPVQASTPTVEGKEQIAALIRRDYPFMSEDCIQQILDEM